MTEYRAAYNGKVRRRPFSVVVRLPTYRRRAAPFIAGAVSFISDFSSSRRMTRQSQHNAQAPYELRGDS